MPTPTKRVPFKLVKFRTRKLKPVWHDFNCLDCGVGVREYSDPRGSFFLCDGCIDRRLGRKPTPQTRSPQVISAGDWWTTWAIEYESKLSAGLIDRWGKEASL